MLDLIVAGSSLVLAVINFVFVVYLLQRDRPEPPLEDPKPICGCQHHFSFHDEKGCHKTLIDEYGHPTNHVCGCVKYIGPIAYDALP